MVTSPHLSRQVIWPAVAIVVALTLQLLEDGIERIWVLALLRLPGTFVHEMSHFIVALILRGEPDSLSVIPHRDGRRVTLGAVGFARLTWYNAAPIALAPLWLWYLFWLDPPAGAMTSTLYGFLLPSSVPSWQDWKTAFSRPLSPLLWAGCVALIVFTSRF